MRSPNPTIVAPVTVPATEGREPEEVLWSPLGHGFHDARKLHFPPSPTILPLGGIPGSSSRIPTLGSNPNLGAPDSSPSPSCPCPKGPARPLHTSLYVWTGRE
jgi:hypothetical protein